MRKKGDTVMDLDAFSEMVLGEDAVQCQRWQRVIGSTAMADALWPLVQQVATWQCPGWITDTGLVEVCRRVAGLDALGRHVCAQHWRLLWSCAGCGAFLPEGTSGYCSQACTSADHGTATWLGQLLGARYSAPAANDEGGR
jgi:hypothetical protein